MKLDYQDQATLWQSEDSRQLQIFGLLDHYTKNPPPLRPVLEDM